MGGPSRSRDIGRGSHRSGRHSDARGRSRGRRGRGSHPSGGARLPVCANKSDSIIRRGSGADLLGKRAPATFAKSDSPLSALSFREERVRGSGLDSRRGYERDGIASESIEIEFSRRERTSTYAPVLEIFGRLGHRWMIWGELAKSYDEIDIESRASKRAADFGRFSGTLAPCRDVGNFFSAKLEKGRTARPPFAPYVVADSVAPSPWIPTDEPRALSLEKRTATQKGFSRYAGLRAHSIGGGCVISDSIRDRVRFNGRFR